jgi:type II secretory pathway pseudopilin PulG
MELLVVLAIIGILASLLLPATSRVRANLQIHKARFEMNALVSAISEYASVYSRYPVSDEAFKASSLWGEDATYGGVIKGTQVWIAGPADFRTNNCEIMAVLLDLEFYADGTPTINEGHVKNPKKRRFLDLDIRGGTNALPGVGIDGMYRDPWGSPYVVSIDLNGDGNTRDSLYQRPSVSENPTNRNIGLNRLVKSIDSNGATIYEVPAPVTVWSPGPDGLLDTNTKANEGWNRDNLLSWMR